MPILHLLFAVCAAQSSISEERLVQCYEAHPFFLEALMMISDEDFASGEKSQERKAQIRTEYVKSPDMIRSCLNDIIQFSKDQYEFEEAKYVALRMSEVSAVVREGAEQSGSGSRDETVQ